MSINVIVNGAHGRLGQVACDAIEHSDQFALCAKGGRGDDLGQLIKTHQADVVLELTQPHCVYDNTKTILEQGARPVVGATGLTPEQIDELSQHCEQLQRGAIIAPNFSLGALMTILLSQQAAKYFQQVEIIELHHAEKLDAPSGTAVKTAHAIKQAQPDINAQHPTRDIPIHSVRLPGLVAHQTVLFGGTGETLTLRHDSNDRRCFQPGILMACERVMKLEHLVYGLEKLLIEQ